MTKRIMTDLELKSYLHQQCIHFVASRAEIINNTIAEIQQSLTSETKSSAGDKHETGRAMLQLEREKAGNQLAEVEKLKEGLSKIDIHKLSDRIGIGSIVYTDKANFFMCISAGDIKVYEISFFAISPNTPIGLLLIGKTVGDSIVFRERTYNISKVL